MRWLPPTLATLALVIAYTAMAMTIIEEGLYIWRVYCNVSAPSWTPAGIPFDITIHCNTTLHLFRTLTFKGELLNASFENATLRFIIDVYDADRNILAAHIDSETTIKGEDTKCKIYVGDCPYGVVESVAPKCINIVCNVTIDKRVRIPSLMQPARYRIVVEKLSVSAFGKARIMANNETKEVIIRGSREVRTYAKAETSVTIMPWVIIGVTGIGAGSALVYFLARRREFSL